jgi:FeS assembly SUF system protein
MRGLEMTPLEKQVLELKVVTAIQTCYDPEIPVNIHDLGLIYGIDINPESEVRITMTLTAPGCPAAAALPTEVQSRVSAIEGVKAASVDLVWDPPWTPDRMSEAAKLQLGFI